MIGINLIPKIIGYKIFRNIGKPTFYPFNYTISVTSKCNLKCKTCNIWKNQPLNELNLKEWEKIFSSLGKSPLWITISGGEPFLRKDLVSIVKLISKYNKPQILNIATNGILTEKIVSDVNKIITFYKGKLIINISIDGLKEKHNFIRGNKCFDKVIETYNRLKKIKKITVGIHTVISKYNVKDIPKIYDYINKLNPDSHIFEIAEKRKELQNLDLDFIPLSKDYFKTIDFLMKNKKKFKGISKLTYILRKKYYLLSKKALLTKKEIVPCYAGVASAHINHNGDLWACCIKCDVLGNLRENNFKDIWKSSKARKVREKIKNEKCYCTLANTNYSNMICDFL